MDHRQDRTDAFTEYVHARGTVMLRTAVHLCAGDVAAAEDLVQNTLVRTYVSWNRVRDPSLRDAYVRRTMVRLAARPGRRPTPVAWLPDPPPRGSHEEALTERDAIAAHLAALPAL